MRAFYKKLFDIKDNDRISDKQMLMRVITTISVIVVCLVAMSVVAYSYYNLSIQTGSSTVSLNRSRFKVTVSAANDNVQNDSTDYTTTYGDYFTDVSLKGANQTYTITITLADGSTSDGFCTLLIGNSGGPAIKDSTDNEYHTVQFGSVDGGCGTTLSFKVKTPASGVDNDNPVTVRVGSCWGTSAKTGSKVKNNCVYTISTISSTSNWGAAWAGLTQ